MKIITFNLRYDNEWDGINSFTNRRERIVRTINELQPEVIGFQEALPAMAEYLRENLHGYYIVGVERDADYGGEAVIVAYRYDRVNLHMMQNFWLSETPDVPGSRYTEQSTCPRTCTVVNLYSYEAKRLFRVINTHLDHEGTAARELGLGQILDYIDTQNRIKYIPTILMGDFNALPDSEELEQINKRSDIYEGSATVNLTFHGFGPEEDLKKIDYIYLSKDINLIRAGVVTAADGYLTDHYPVYADIEIV